MAIQMSPELIHSKVLLRWYDNKAIIEHISQRPLRVIFEDDAMKYNLMSNSGKFAKPWQKLAYIVDVQVQTIENKPTMYKIMNWYPEDTFDPSE